MVRQRWRGRALYSGRWPRYQSALSTSRSVRPVRCAMAAQACTAQARISRSCGPGRSAAPGVDVGRQALVVDEHALAAQDVGDEVVGEDRQRVEIVELGHAAERKVARRDLRALVEPLVLPHRHAAREQLGHPHGRAVGGRDDVERVAVAEEAPELAQGLRVERHQLVVARLAERVGDLVGAHRAQLRVGPAGTGAPAVGQRPGHGEVARATPCACAGSETSPSRS